MAVETIEVVVEVLADMLPVLRPCQHLQSLLQLVLEEMVLLNKELRVVMELLQISH